MRPGARYLPQAVKQWIRNGDQGRHSFSLPLAGGNFYPDFVAELDDGRIFVVEHKGAHLANDPWERQKEVVGRHWAKRSGGACLFVMVTQTQDGSSLAKKITDAIE